MRIAIPLMGSRIAPRLCFAQDLLVVETDGREVRDWRRAVLGDRAGVWSFVEWALSQGIELILCCGVNRQACAALTCQGIQILWGLTGEAEEVLAAYLEGGLEGPVASAGAGREPWGPSAFAGPGRGFAGGRGEFQGRGRRGRRGRGRARGGWRLGDGGPGPVERRTKTRGAERGTDDAET